MQQVAFNRASSWPASRFVVVVSFLLLASCDGSLPSAPTDTAAHPGSIFTEVAAASGLDFVHVNGATGDFYYPEIVQGGAAFLDYDGDSFLDVYLVQSGPLPPVSGSELHADRLYRNRGDGSYEEQSELAGLTDRSYGSGVAASDFDRDGWVDLYVTNLGRNVLYHNQGDGTFLDVTESAGVGDPGYSTSAAFFDYDADGDLDLYVCNYVVWSPKVERPCKGRSGLRSYCQPAEYQPQADTLYRNEGDGRFTDQSAFSGIGNVAAAGLGVVTGDFDSDGTTDLYVANDQMANFLWLNNGDGTFRDEALLRGAALNGRGQAEAGMGVIAEDPDGDGDWDLFMVHLGGETNTFYRNHGGSFRDATDELGLGTVSQASTGFGVGMFDYDNDTQPDIFIANGKVSPGDLVENDFREHNQLLRGLGNGAFEDVSAQAGAAMSLREVSRAAAFGDYDNDGDVDVLVANNGGPVRLLRNDVGEGRHWLVVDLDGGARFGRSAVGAIVTVDVAGNAQTRRRQRRQCQPAYGYCASHDARLHFGLGDAEAAERVEVIWPDGTKEVHVDVAADQILVLTFAQGRVESSSGAL